MRKAAPITQRAETGSWKTNALLAPVSSTLLVVLSEVAVVDDSDRSAFVKQVIMPARACNNWQHHCTHI